MNYRQYIVLVFGTIAFSVGILGAKSKPFTIINASGQALYLSWLHKGVKTAPFFVYVRPGGDIRIKNWDIDKETVIFVAKVKDMILKDEGSLNAYRFGISNEKTINVKIKRDLLLYPNALFGDLKEKDIKVKCEKEGSTFDVSIKDLQQKTCKPLAISFPYTAQTIKFIPQEQSYKENLEEFLKRQR